MFNALHAGIECRRQACSFLLSAYASMFIFFPPGYRVQTAGFMFFAVNLRLHVLLSLCAYRVQTADLMFLIVSLHLNVELSTSRYCM